MKKVAHIINSKIYSGLENVVCAIMEYFKENYKDIDMVYVTQDGPIVEVLKEKKLNYYIIDKMNTKNINKLIKEYKPDVLHAHDFTASVICALTNTKIPIINHLHNNSAWIKKLNINSIAYLYAGVKAKKILTVSPSIENEYIFSSILKNKIECIGNPICRDKILSKIKNENNNKKYDICCVARVVEQKNPIRFLKILSDLKKKIPNINVVWVGKGELLDDVLKKVEEFDLKNNIEFVGFKKNPYEYMQNSKIFMLTSSTEGFGLVAFEALAIGLPCVVSNVGGLPTIVDDDCGKLCNTDSDFISEIEKLLKNNDYLKRKSSFAIEKSKKIDNIDDYMKKIKKVYGGVLNEKKC